MRRIVTRSVSLARFYVLQRGLRTWYRWAILVVVTVLAIVAAPRLIHAVYPTHSPQTVTVEQDLAAIAIGLQLYKQDNGRYPTNQQRLLALIIKPSRAPIPQDWQTGGYLERLPRDPWGHTYQYRLAADEQSFEVFSFGPNGQNENDDSPNMIHGKH